MKHIPPRLSNIDKRLDSIDGGSGDIRYHISYGLRDRLTSHAEKAEEAEAHVRSNQFVEMLVSRSRAHSFLQSNQGSVYLFWGQSRYFLQGQQTAHLSEQPRGTGVLPFKRILTRDFLQDRGGAPQFMREDTISSPD